MDDINGVPTDEYYGPTFSVNLHDSDGDIYSEGIFLHYGNTIIKVASTLRGFKAHASGLFAMADEISENIDRLR